VQPRRSSRGPASRRERNFARHAAIGQALLMVAERGGQRGHAHRRRQRQLDGERLAEVLRLGSTMRSPSPFVAVAPRWAAAGPWSAAIAPGPSIGLSV
jgi:hypothetical protein